MIRIGGSTVDVDRARGLYPDHMRDISPRGILNVELVQSLVGLGLYIEVGLFGEQPVRYDPTTEGRPLLQST